MTYTHSIDNRHQMAVNLNIGILGHVDCGKTTLAKKLSHVASTAAFDKDPQSKIRGITLDLGFSSFIISTPSHLRQQMDIEKIRYTLVDCPGHASLIKTVIGGAQIIDLILLVIDITKGIQMQTAECLVIGEITCKRMIIVLNKTDLLPVDKLETAVEKMKKKIKLTLKNTAFSNSTIVAISVNPVKEEGISSLIDEIVNHSFVPDRQIAGPFLFAVDHCFGIKGQGTVLTGTVLQGTINLNDAIEIPAMNIERKIKSIQVFREPVTIITQGDRAGICVTQFDSKQFERGLVCSPNYAKFVHCGIIAINRIKYFKFPIKSKSKFHITIGYETTLGTITLFTTENSNNLIFENEYQFLESLDPTVDQADVNLKYFMLIEFDKPVLAVENCLIIGSKLDLNFNTSNCRIAFWGNLLCFSNSKDYRTTLLPKIKIFKSKKKNGIIERIVNDNTVIVKNMFKKETQLNVFTGMQVQTSLGDIGKIESSFGKSGKIKVVFESELSEKIKNSMSVRNSDVEIKQNNKIEVFLSFKKYLYDVNKKLYQ